MPPRLLPIVSPRPAALQYALRGFGLSAYETLRGHNVRVSACPGCQAMQHAGALHASSLSPLSSGLRPEQHTAALPCAHMQTLPKQSVHRSVGPRSSSRPGAASGRSCSWFELFNKPSNPLLPTLHHRWLTLPPATWARPALLRRATSRVRCCWPAASACGCTGIPASLAPAAPYASLGTRTSGLNQAVRPAVRG